jgi:periplasmic divalent cation tolerance protein
MENPIIIILTTAGSKQEAEKIVNALLEQRLIACANIMAVSSRYWWGGKIDCAEEFLVVMKSRRELFDGVVLLVKGFHSYEVPEVLAVSVVEGSLGYLDWMASVLK